MGAAGYWPNIKMLKIQNKDKAIHTVNRSAVSKQVQE